MPSPTIATRPALGLQPLDEARLVGGQLLADSAVGPNADLRARPRRRSLVVARDEPHVQPAARPARAPRPRPLSATGSRRGTSPRAVRRWRREPAFDPAPTRVAGRRSAGRVSTPARPAAARLPTTTRRASTVAVDALPGDRLELPRLAGSRARRGCARRDDRPRHTDARCLAPRTRPGRSPRARRSRRDVDRRRRPAVPSVSVPVLSNTTVSTRPALSSAAALRTRIPVSAARPVPTITAVGVARPIAHGQAMTSTAMNALSANVSRGSGPSSSQPANVSDASDEHERDEHLADPVGEALDRRLRSLRALDHRDDRREQPSPGRRASPA